MGNLEGLEITVYYRIVRASDRHINRPDMDQWNHIISLVPIKGMLLPLDEIMIQGTV